ncbi:MAG: class I SAM-dependent methyltransferase [Phycisphaerae bacterium]|nr:class I SAM-dependent methyltransferase [Phycisphaerae bacterium]
MNRSAESGGDRGEGPARGGAGPRGDARPGVPKRWREEDIPPVTSADYWPAFFRAVEGQPPRETLVRALDLFDAEWGHAEGAGGRSATREACPCHPDAVGVALDLGCGEGRDTLEMLRRRWCVLAVDGSAAGIERLRARVPAETAHLFRTGVETFEEMPLPPGMFDLVNASFALPHVPAERFGEVWARVAGSIKPGGRFAGQFFGVNDQWRSEPDGLPRTFHTRAEVESLLVGFEVEWLDEVERAGFDAFGRPRRWHVFHVVAKKRPCRS